MKVNAFLIAFVVVFAFWVSLFTGCASVPVKDIGVDAEADPRVNFNGYRSYAWLGSAAILNDAEGRWEPPGFDADAEVKFLIDRELRGRGMSETADDPDLIVAFALGVDMDALGLKKEAGESLEILRNVPRSGLVIAFVDDRTRQVIWLGLATAEIQPRPEVATAKARLDYAVTKLLKRIPK